MNIANMAAGLAVEAAIEMVLTAYLVRAIMDTIENLLKGMIKAMEMAELPSSTRAVEVASLLGQKILVSDVQLAEEKIDRRDNELDRAHQRIEALESQRFEAKWDCHQAHDDIKCLKRMLEERQKFSSKVCLPRGSNRRLNKRPRSSKNHHGGETSQRSEVSSFRRGSITQEPSAELQAVRERLKQLEKTRNDLVAKTCRLGFSTSFEKCKEIALAHLPADSIEFLQIDENLRSIICFCLKRFTSASNIIIGTNKVDSAVQTKEVEAEGGPSEMGY
ncbi:hypothetical protein COCNU_scaffold024834G000010 [Cocos nucifera]|nr:hypothetical protein [Cocos nucifera]